MKDTEIKHPDTVKIAIASFHTTLRRIDKNARNITLETFGITQQELNKYQSFAVDVKAGEL